MFLGHYAAGLAAKKFVPDTSLGTLLLAAIWLDIVWPVFLLLGWEQVSIVEGITTFTPLDFVFYPWSHSLAAVILWGGVVGGIYWTANKNKKAALIVGLLVISHWFLDLIVHRPDLPIGFADSPKVGLGLWFSITGTLAVEGVIFALGSWIYIKSTRPVDRIGRWGVAGFLLTLTLIYLSQLSGAAPPSTSALAVVALMQLLLILFGWWIDRHRQDAVK